MNKKVLILDKIETVLCFIAVILMFVLMILVACINTDSLMQTIVCEVYLFLSICLVISLKVPCIRRKIEFKFKYDLTWSFVAWNFLVSLFIGVTVGVVFYMFKGGDVINLCIIMSSVVMTVISLVWFTHHIFCKTCNIVLLDLYSSIIIAVLTALSLTIDYKEYKISFLLVFIDFLLIQILIKIKNVMNKNY